MAQEKLTIEGVTYLSDPALVFGDYGGAGSVGKSNIDYLKEEFPDFLEIGMRYDWYEKGWEQIPDFDPAKPPMLLVAYGDWSSEQAWLMDSLEGQEVMDALESYPSLDDERMSRVEMEWEQEAWESWLKSDLLQTLDEDTREFAEGLSDEVLFEAYRRAMDETNTYPVPEYNGVHVAVNQISENFAGQIIALMEE